VISTFFVLAAVGSAGRLHAQSDRYDNPPPERGGFTKALGLPPVYKGSSGFEVQWYRPGGQSDLGGFATFGLSRDIGSPVVGLGAVELLGYLGFRNTELDGGGRALLNLPVLYLGVGADYNATDDDFSFLFRVKLPIRRGGIFGRGSMLTLQWLPGRGSTFGAGITVPLWGSNLGKTRARHDYVRLPKRDPYRVALDVNDPALQSAIDSLQARVRGIARLTQPFAEKSGGEVHRVMAPVVADLRTYMATTDELFPVGHTVNEEIRVYHEVLEHAFSVALSKLPVEPQQSTETGRRVSAVARRYLLDDVLFAYNYLLGQRKKDDALRGMAAVAQTDFARWLLAETAIESEQARRAFYVFQSLCDFMEKTRHELRARWIDTRLVWLPLQYGLKPEEHDTQIELDAILERATHSPFARGNRCWYIINEQFQWEMVRSVRRAEDYHVLWVHDIRGKNDKGEPDVISYAQTANYLQALIERVRAYDETGKLPVYMIYLDQHYFEINKSRTWLRLLKKPLDYELDLPSGYEDWETELRHLQDQLRQAVKESHLLQVEASQFGKDWLENRVRIQVNITNPADPSFFSHHVVGIYPVPDNNMRDHRKIAFYDITEEDPYRGMAMFTGMGIGEHYVGTDWEDRALMIQGPGALAVKDAARQLVQNQGFAPDEIPFPLRPQPVGESHMQQVAAELAAQPAWMHDSLKLMQLHNQTGFRSKPINVAKAVLYSLMPPGSVIKVPDALWQNYLYASLLSCSALRGCRVLIMAPTEAAAASAAAPTLARAHDLLARLLVFSDEMSGAIDAAGGLLKMGLYSPRQGVGDIAGRMKQAVDVTVPWAHRVYPENPNFTAVARHAGEQLDSLGYRPRYLIGEDSIARPKLHLKANLFATATAWDKLAARPEWGQVLRQYIVYLADLNTPTEEGQPEPDVRAIPEQLHADVQELLANFVADLTAEERQELAYYFTLGSVNMDYRSMCLDGEAMIVLSGWHSLVGSLDFFLLVGLCDWPETTDELDKLLPSPGGLTRRLAGLMKLML
jgi:hypothetical protein